MSFTIRHLSTPLLFILSSFLHFSILAQSLGTVSGIITSGGKAVEYANVAVYQANDLHTVLDVVISDSIGGFVLSNLNAGSYILSIQMLGILDKTIPFSVTIDQPFIPLGTINVDVDSKVLNAIEITGQREIIKKTSTGFIINAKDNISQIGGTATDLLRSTPTVVVDPEGGISIRGKAPLILINGRNSKLSNTNLIPASSIETIEIINNPSAQYDADADGGIINIVLKKNRSNGTNGSFAVGAGYGARGRLNSSFIINNQTGKWNVGLAYDNRFGQRIRKAVVNRTSYFLPDQYQLSQNRLDDRFEQTHNLRFDLDYTPNKKNSFTFEIIGEYDGQDNGETLGSKFETQAKAFVNKNTRFSRELESEKVLEFDFNYKHYYANPRQRLAINASSALDSDGQNTDITTQALSINDSAIGKPLLQRTNYVQPSSVSNLRLDYAHPIGTKGTIETGYKAIARYTNADYRNQTLVNTDYITNLKTTNVFTFQEQVHAAYLQYRSYIGKADSTRWQYDIGLRAEQVLNNGHAATNDISFNRSYFNFFPTGNIAYYLNATDFVKLSFTRRINRPVLEQLNPFIDITDSLNPHSGNPYLKPELINALEMGYNKEWKKISFTANIFYRYSTNIIRPFIVLDNNGVALAKPANYGSATIFGVESIVNINPTTFWSFNTSVSLYEQDIAGGSISPDIANNYISYYGKMIHNLNLWKDSKLQLIGNYNSPVAIPQGTKIAIYNVDMGFQQKILRGNGAFGLVVTDVFNTQKSGTNVSAYNFAYDRTFKIDTRAVLFTFTYSFKTTLKEELMENKFSND